MFIRSIDKINVSGAYKARVGFRREETESKTNWQRNGRGETEKVVRSL